MRTFSSFFAVILLAFLAVGCDLSPLEPAWQLLTEDCDPPSWYGHEGVSSAEQCGSEITVRWGRATDLESPPVVYLVYVDTDPKLWNKDPILVDCDDSITFTVSDPSKDYYVGVRVRDSAFFPNTDYNRKVIKAEKIIYR
jgi:hypothetical protein